MLLPITVKCLIILAFKFCGAMRCFYICLESLSIGNMSFLKARIYKELGRFNLP